jgi:hypothetical protein
MASWAAHKKRLILLLGIGVFVCLAIVLWLTAPIGPFARQRHIAHLILGEYDKIYTPQVLLVPPLDNASTIQAQKLLDNPIPLPAFLAWTRPAPGSTLREAETICFLISKGLFTKGEGGEFWPYLAMENPVDDDLQITVNGLPVPNDSLSIIAGDSLNVVAGQPTTDSTFCISALFAPKTNLVKLELNVPSANKVDTYTYQWAYLR